MRFEALASLFAIRSETYDLVFRHLKKDQDLARVLRRITVERITSTWKELFGADLRDFPHQVMRLTPCVRAISEEGIEVGIPVYIPHATATQTEAVLRKLLGVDSGSITCKHEEIRITIDILVDEDMTAR
jgi:hypothetical protein